MSDKIRELDNSTVATHDAVICTDELEKRPCRSPNFELENKLLLVLSQKMANEPTTILQSLSDAIKDGLAVHSSGISLLKNDNNSFFWPAISGELAAYVGEGTPRDFGPCGDVLDRNRPLLFMRPARRYDYINQIKPAIEELLLVPFYYGNKAVGTVWAISHTNERRFDKEDLRLLTGLSKFAAAAYWTSESLGELQASQMQSLRLIAEINDLNEKRQTSLKSELKNASAELVRADEELRTIAMLVTKQIQEPAKILSSYLKLLAVRYKGQLGKDADEFIEKCLQSSKSIGRMLDALWFYSRASGKGEMKGATLSDLLEKAIKSVNDEIEQSGAVITKPSAMPTINCDPEHLEFVFKCLIENAIKYCKPGKTAQIEITCVEKDKKWLLCFADEGIGIDPMDAKNVFKPFTRLSGRNDQSGTGMNLAISERMVTAHKGKMWVESLTARGAKFYISLPKR